VNEAVEKAIQHSKFELLKKNLFSVLTLKNKDETILTKENVVSEQLQSQPLQIDDISLSNDNFPDRSYYTLTVKPILDLEGKMYQLLFVFRDKELSETLLQEDSFVLDQMITKQQAMIENIRIQLIERGEHDLVFKAALIGKLDREIRMLIDLQSDSVKKAESTVDVIRVVKNTCDVMMSFADKVHVNLEFSQDTENTNQKDTLPAQIDLLWFDVLLHKLIEIAILLASSAHDLAATVTVKQSKDTITVIITSSYKDLEPRDTEKLFIPNYGDLQVRTNLKLASGLEGYIACQISEKIGLPITTERSEQGTAFILSMNRAREKSALDM
jgi:hypothetical protein